MAVQTSQVTTATNGTLTIAPNGTGNTKVNSIVANNPGTTIVGIGSDKVLKKLVITDLPTKAAVDTNDWIMLHDTSTGQLKKVLTDNL